jgi:hypothetical protein
MAAAKQASASAGCKPLKLTSQEWQELAWSVRAWSENMIAEFSKLAPELGATIDALKAKRAKGGAS